MWKFKTEHFNLFIEPCCWFRPWKQKHRDGSRKTQRQQKTSQKCIFLLSLSIPQQKLNCVERGKFKYINSDWSQTRDNEYWILNCPALNNVFHPKIIWSTEVCVRWQFPMSLFTFTFPTRQYYHKISIHSQKSFSFVDVIASDVWRIVKQRSSE